MNELELLDYLNKNDFKKHLKNMTKKLRNKSVLLYGAGKLFSVIDAYFDLSGINIIAISDKKFSTQDEGSKYLGYPVVPFETIKLLNIDYVLLSTLNFVKLIEDFETQVFKNSRVKVRPLINKPFGELYEEVKNYK